MEKIRIPTIKEKLEIKAILHVVTGLHIGTSNDFSPIGAVDSVVVRDPVTRKPIIPGSSLKGKLRSLLARTQTDDPWLPQIKKEPDSIKRLFGAQGEFIARLQFSDLKMTEESVNALKKAETDLYLTEIKFENSISRLTAIATPRQIERVPAGASFSLYLIYNIENLDEIDEDFKNIAKAFRLLEVDYLGKGGTRGNGRVSFTDFSVTPLLGFDDLPVDYKSLEGVLNNATRL
jgi:CRISPR-associated protein Csm3